MMLKEEIRQRLLADRGVTPLEACDRCGALLGAVRYVRERRRVGVWCSPECRGEGDWRKKESKS